MIVMVPDLSSCVHLLILQAGAGKDFHSSIMTRVRHTGTQLSLCPSTTMPTLLSISNFCAGYPQPSSSTTTQSFLATWSLSGLDSLFFYIIIPILNFRFCQYGVILTIFLMLLLVMVHVWRFHIILLLIHQGYLQDFIPLLYSLVGLLMVSVFLWPLYLSIFCIHVVCQALLLCMFC